MGVGAAVAGFLTASGASAGVAAVGGAIAAGAVTGAVVGAATSLITGGNVLEGALKGAAIGGAGGGILSGAGMATGLSTAESQLGAMGAEGFSATTAAPEVGAEVGSIGAETGPYFQPGGAPTAAAAQPGLLERAGTFLTGGESGISPDRAKIYAGIGQGAFEGLGQAASAKIGADEAKELAQWKEKQIALNRAANIPGTFNASVANITTPDRWSANLQRKGLLQ